MLTIDYRATPVFVAMRNIVKQIVFVVFSHVLRISVDADEQRIWYGFAIIIERLIVNPLGMTG